MKQEISAAVEKALISLDISGTSFRLEYPDNSDHGDFSCNAAMVNAKRLGMAPKVLADKLVKVLRDNLPSSVQSVEIAGPGFINFKVKDAVYAEQIVSVAQGDGEYGWNTHDAGKQILIEYTDPNIFKAFHIGHLMANSIGESLSRLIQASGASLTRLCYPSDIGLHIAKSIWAMKKHLSEVPGESATIQEKTTFLGTMYVEGTRSYDADPAVKIEIDALNKVIYDKSDAEVNALYDKGRAWSLAHFELLYAVLGTKFDAYLYESDMAPVGLDIVRAHIGNVFQESEGAVIFKGEDYGLHTRVFINSHGLPTYETKEMGLNTTKFKQYPKTDQSIVITASEQNDYFRVVLKALELIDENVGTKTKHIGHGMLRFSSGKMSSRTGNVITMEALLGEIKDMVMEKIADREFSATEKAEIAETVALGAIRYTILRQSIGGDVIFDSAASISFEGDSGPYLQYAAVRANSILEKAQKEGVRSTEKGAAPIALPEHVSLVEKLISRFPDIVERARIEYSPQHVANYLVALAGAFNAYYAANQIVSDTDPLSPYRVDLTKAFHTVMVNGLWLLGIKVPKRM
jgi:arginyl-tRNA synthetase